jgi:hypothetical protein
MYHPRVGSEYNSLHTDPKHWDKGPFPGVARSALELGRKRFTSQRVWLNFTAPDASSNNENGRTRAIPHGLDKVRKFRVVWVECAMSLGAPVTPADLFGARRIRFVTPRGVDNQTIAAPGRDTAAVRWNWGSLQPNDLPLFASQAHSMTFVNGVNTQLTLSAAEADTAGWEFNVRDAQFNEIAVCVYDRDGVTPVNVINLSMVLEVFGETDYFEYDVWDKESPMDPRLKHMMQRM